MSIVNDVAPNADHPPSEVGFDDVVSAAGRIRGMVNRTPVMTSRRLDARLGRRVYLKCENFQRVGAFKFRGASNALAVLKEDAARRGAAAPGVLTYSSGNHAQAVALAGRELGVATTIVMPSDAPAVKLEATRGYQGPGDEVVTYDRSSVTREELGGRLSSERGLTIVPPYDDPAVIAGQGTAGLELCEELTAGGAGPLDALFVCCGGGGLLSGCAIAAKAMMPGCRVVGVEPAAGDDATRSFRSRTLHTVRDPETIADGARTPSLGRWTFPLVLRHVDEMRTVSDEQLIAAMRLSMQRMKLVVEPSGVLGLAGLIDAVERGELGAGVERVGVLVSGGNVDLGRLAAWVG